MLLTEPVRLENAHVVLEPLTLAHAPDLERATEGLEYAWYTSVPNDVDAEIAKRLAWHAEGTMNPWAVIDRASGAAVGMTTLCNIDQANRHVEIGHTWIGTAAQRTAINTASKLLLLGHAFEACDAIAVEFRTSWQNRQSRTAIERLEPSRTACSAITDSDPTARSGTRSCTRSSRTSGPACASR